MKTYHMYTSNSYNVKIGSGLLSKTGELIKEIDMVGKCCIVTDDNVNKYFGDKVVKSMTKMRYYVKKFVFPHGEEHKNYKTLLDIYKFLSDNLFNRDDFIVALGGGVVGDMAGFAAATFMRGINYIQIPTTLLGYIDSSIGGKTSVNTEEGKNIIGLIYQPKLVIIDIDTLNSLPSDFFSDGIAEIIKYGMIRSKELFELLEKEDIKLNILKIICKCVEIKKEIVENDEFEKNGERMLLNFGHTLGYSIEKFYNYKGISHGRAISIGMSIFTHIAENNGMCVKGLANKLDKLLLKYKLPITTDAPLDKLFSISLKDKKNTNSGINIVYCKDIGVPKLDKMSEEEYKFFLTGE